MKFLIFEPHISGHHLEYILHMLTYANSCQSGKTFYFILNEKYESMLINNHILSDNVTIEYISHQYACLTTNSHWLLSSYKLSKCLKFYHKKFNPDKIILPWLYIMLPILSIFIHKKRIFRGIIYNCPKLKEEKFLKKLKNYVLFRHIFKSTSFDRIWLLNNSTLAERLNKKYNTNIFFTLPDPINIIESLNNSIINKYRNTDKIILFHGGSMTKDKGTIDFIDALKKMPKDYQNKFIIIFGGRVGDPIDRQYLLDFIKNNPSFQIIYDDKFISYQNLCSYISISDYVVIPYKRIQQSSGILGYAALYNVPVIGPKKGLLGQLIIDNNLGITLSDTSPKYLSDRLMKINKKVIKHKNLKSEQYVSTNSIKNFVAEIFAIDKPID